MKSKASIGPLILLVTLALTGCGHTEKPCARPIVPEHKLQATPPLIEPEDDNDLAVLDADIENYRRAGLCYAAHAELIRTVKAVQQNDE